MKKINQKILIALLAVVLVAGASIFYACKKEKGNNSDKNLNKETEFVARIHEKLCVQVDVFRDEHNNVHIMTKETDNDPKVTMGIIIPNAINIKHQNAKNGEENAIIEIPDDAIHWFVSLDGNEPVKVPSGGIKIYCTCTEGKPNCFETGLTCPPPVISGSGFNTVISCPHSQSCCKTCTQKTGNTVVVGSTYLVRSDAITVNGITYE